MSKLPRSKRQNKREIAFSELQAIAESLDFFRTPSGVAMVRLPEGNGRAERADTSRFRDYLIDRYSKEHGKPVPKTTLETFISSVLAHVRMNGPERDVFVRVACVDGEINLDLGGDKGRIIHATATGWQPVATTDVVFVRPAGQRALPEPSRQGSLDELWALLNIPPADRPFVAVWMVSALLQDHPMALLVLEGPEGSGKTAAAQFLKELMDPQVAGLSSLPTRGDDMFLSAEGAAVLAFDNLSGISSDMSDHLCRLLSGGGMRTRALYSQSEERVFAGRRPIVLNGITSGVDRADLLNRAIIVRMPRIPARARRTLRKLNAEFERLRPAALGALLDLVVLALARRGSVVVEELPRLADLGEIGAAIEQGVGLPAGGFIPLFKQRERENSNALMGTDPLFTGVLALAKEGTWEGSLGELETRLRDNLAIEGDERLPNGGAALGKALRRLEASLAQRGVAVTYPRTAGERRVAIARMTAGPQ